MFLLSWKVGTFSTELPCPLSEPYLVNNCFHDDINLSGLSVSPICSSVVEIEKKHGYQITPDEEIFNVENILSFTQTLQCNYKLLCRGVIIIDI